MTDLMVEAEAEFVGDGGAELVADVEVGWRDMRCLAAPGAPWRWSTLELDERGL